MLLDDGIEKKQSAVDIIAHRIEVINNLVKIYGKEGLDYLREERNLKFIPQDEIVWKQS